MDAKNLSTMSTCFVAETDLLLFVVAFISFSIGRVVHLIVVLYWNDAVGVTRCQCNIAERGLYFTSVIVNVSARLIALERLNQWVPADNPNVILCAFKVVMPANRMGLNQLWFCSTSLNVDIALALQRRRFDSCRTTYSWWSYSQLLLARISTCVWFPL